MSLLTDASLLLTPNAYKASKLYSVIPSNGNGDFTATRATTATRINSSGLLESVALNVPRLDYSLGGCPNILLEPQRTNLALQSSSFDSASWFRNASSVTANSTTSPSGIVDADTWTANGTSSQKYLSLVGAGNLTSGITYTTSIYAKKNTNNFIQIAGSNAYPAGSVFANFDLNNGVVGSVGALTTARIENVGNGWYRCIITATSTGGANPFVVYLVSSANSSAAESNTLSTSVFLWGAQLEAGAYATSYIPTTTASVTRNADSITRNNIFTNGLITASGGTWFVELRGNVSLIREAFSTSLNLGDATVNSIGIGHVTGGVSQRLTVRKFLSNVGTPLYTITTDAAKIAIKWNGTTADVFVNGVKVVSATSFPIVNLPTLSASGTDVPKFINEMALFPTPLTDAQCLALTA